MQMTHVSYRKKGKPHNNHAVVPTTWRTYLIQWIQLSEQARIVDVTDNVDHEAMLPDNWPHYRACMTAVELSDLVHGTR